MKRLLGLILAALMAQAMAASARVLRDPFLRPSVVSAPPADAAPIAPATPPRLRSLANIDGQVVATGERVAGYTVRRIDARGVLLAGAGGELLLTMQDKDVP
jgi:hypothetical protein